MSKCTNCSSTHFEGAKYCHVCGASTGLFSMGVASEDTVTKKSVELPQNAFITADKIKNREEISFNIKASSTNSTKFYFILNNEGNHFVKIQLISKSNDLTLSNDENNTSATPTITLQPHSRNYRHEAIIKAPRDPLIRQSSFEVEIISDGFQSRKKEVIRDDTKERYMFDKRFLCDSDGLCESGLTIKLDVTYLQAPELNVVQEVLYFTENVRERQLTIENKGESELILEGIEIPSQTRVYISGQTNPLGQISREDRRITKLDNLVGHGAHHLIVEADDPAILPRDDQIIVTAHVGKHVLEKKVKIVKSSIEVQEQIPAAVFGIDFGTQNTSISYMEIGTNNTKKGFVTDRDNRIRWPSLMTYNRKKKQLLFGKEAEIPGSGIEINYLTHFQITGLKSLIRGDEDRYKDDKYHRSVFKVHLGNRDKPIFGDKIDLLAKEELEKIMQQDDKGNIRKDKDRQASLLSELKRQISENLVDETKIHGPEYEPERSKYLEDFSNENLLVEYLKYLHSLIRDHIVKNPNKHEGFESGDPNQIYYKVYFTLPVLDRDLRSGVSNDKALLTRAARKADFHEERFEWLLEPEAAALYFIINWEEKSQKYKWRGGLEDGALILVFDAGAGTTDVALLKVNLKRNQISFETIGICGGSKSSETSEIPLKVYGGEDITELVKEGMIKANLNTFINDFQIINPDTRNFYGKIPGTGSYINKDGLETRISESMLHDFAEDMKKGLNPTEEGSKPPPEFKMRVMDQLLILSNNDFESETSSIFNSMVQLVDYVLSEKGNILKENIPPARIKHFFCVGGTSNIHSLTGKFRSLESAKRDMDADDRMCAVAGGAIEKYSTIIFNQPNLDIFLVGDSTPSRNLFSGLKFHLVKAEDVRIYFEGGFWPCRPCISYPIEIHIDIDGQFKRIGNFHIDNRNSDVKKNVHIYAKIEQEITTLVNGRGLAARMLNIYYKLGDSEIQKAFQYRLK